MSHILILPVHLWFTEAWECPPPPLSTFTQELGGPENTETWCNLVKGGDHIELFSMTNLCHCASFAVHHLQVLQKRRPLQLAHRLKGFNLTPKVVVVAFPLCASATPLATHRTFPLHEDHAEIGANVVVPRCSTSNSTWVNSTIVSRRWWTGVK